MNVKPEKINIHIASPEKMLTDSLCAAINETDFAQVSGISDTLAGCREALNKKKPDILLLEICQSNNKIINILPQENTGRVKFHSDGIVEVKLKDGSLGFIKLPEGNGMDFCTEIKRKYPYIKIIVLAGQSNWMTIRSLLGKKVSGHIMKSASHAELLTGIKEVAERKTFVCNESKKILKQGFDEDFIMIPVRQGQVLLLMAEGFINEEIADILGIETSTVIKYRKVLHRKFLSDGRNPILIKKLVHMRLVWMDIV